MLSGVFPIFLGAFLPLKIPVNDDLHGKVKLGYFPSTIQPNKSPMVRNCDSNAYVPLLGTRGRPGLPDHSYASATDGAMVSALSGKEPFYRWNHAWQHMMA